MTKLNIPRGCVVADVEAYELSAEEITRLQHPTIGGVILFRRNFQSIEQLKKLTAAIKSLRTPELVIAVDHEGGRVQRFIDGFTRLPAMKNLGEIANSNLSEAQRLAVSTGCVLATELRACGIDLSFTPVLDLDWNNCSVIGNRSFHPDPEIVSLLSLSLQQGLNLGGMVACAKHFPGHGYVSGDSHHVLPEDNRSFAQISQADLLPFKFMIDNGLAAIMPAHVLYPNIDNQPAGFSKFWLSQVLREQLGFEGMIFSDDLTMEGASQVGGIKQRADLSLQAGCDVVLVCNRPDLLDELIMELSVTNSKFLDKRWHNLLSGSNQQYYQSFMQQQSFILMQKEVQSIVSGYDSSSAVPVGEEC